MRIGDLARQAGCTVETVRYYEREGLLPRPERSSNNYRLYDRSHLESLCFIRNCRVLEMSLEEIKALLNLKLDSGKDCREVNVLLDEHIAHVTDRISQLESLKNQLKLLRSRCNQIKSMESCAILIELAVPAEPDTLAVHSKNTHVHGAQCSKDK